MGPLKYSGWDTMFNADGFATFGIDRENRQKIISYDQFFKMVFISLHRTFN
jgi:hypothetical protein